MRPQYTSKCGFVYLPESIEESVSVPEGILTLLRLKSSTILDITSCSRLKVNRYFGGTSGLHLHGRRISLLHIGFLIALLFDPEDGGEKFLRNVG
jgi:hypothetical protein